MQVCELLLNVYTSTSLNGTIYQQRALGLFHTRGALQCPPKSERGLLFKEHVHHTQLWCSPLKFNGQVWQAVSFNKRCKNVVGMKNSITAMACVQPHLASISQPPIFTTPWLAF